MPNPSSAKPKVLFYSDSRYYSGAEKVLTLVVQSLAEDMPGSVVMLSPEVKQAVTAAIPHWQTLPLVWDFSATQSKLKLSEVGRLKKLLKQHGITAALINMWSPYANTLAIMACTQSNIPCATIFHYFQPRSNVTGLLAPLKLAAYRWAGKQATRVITVSNAHKSILTQEFGFHADKVSVVHNGLSLRIEAPTKSFTLPRRFVCIGTIENNKGQAYLIPLLTSLAGEWTLSIVGDGPDKAAMEDLVKSLNLQDKITFLGKQTDMEKIYRDHDVLVHPSFAENLSMAILEAMAHKLPVIAHLVGGNPELIDAGSSGWLVPLKDNQAWLKSMEEAITDTDRLKKYAQTAYTHWQTNFQQATMAQGYKDIIQQLGTDAERES